MNGWQEPKDGKRIYLITDNTKMDGFTDYIQPEDIAKLIQFRSNPSDESWIGGGKQ